MLAPPRFNPHLEQTQMTIDREDDHYRKEEGERELPLFFVFRTRAKKTIISKKS